MTDAAFHARLYAITRKAGIAIAQHSRDIVATEVRAHLEDDASPLAILSVIREFREKHPDHFNTATQFAAGA